jgi:hypothetical protein
VKGGYGGEDGSMGSMVVGRGCSRTGEAIREIEIVRIDIRLLREDGR